MLSDNCDVLRTYIYWLTACHGRIEIYPHTYWLQYTSKYDAVAILNVCSTRSTKASNIMLSDNCDVLCAYICWLTACEGECKFTVIRTGTDYSKPGTRQQSQHWTCAVPEAQRRPLSCWVIEQRYQKHKGVHYHAEWWYRRLMYINWVTVCEGESKLSLILVTVSTQSQYWTCAVLEAQRCPSSC